MHGELLPYLQGSTTILIKQHDVGEMIEKIFHRISGPELPTHPLSSQYWEARRRQYPGWVFMEHKLKSEERSVFDIIRKFGGIYIADNVESWMNIPEAMRSHEAICFIDSGSRQIAILMGEKGCKPLSITNQPYHDRNHFEHFRSSGGLLTTDHICPSGADSRFFNIETAIAICHKPGKDLEHNLSIFSNFARLGHGVDRLREVFQAVSSVVERQCISDLAFISNDRNNRVSFQNILRFVYEKYPSMPVVQIGANDGILADPVRSAITRFNASSVLFEPVIEYALLCASNYSSCPNVKVLPLAVSSQEDASDIILQYITPEDIAKHGLPDWTQGIGTSHPDRNAMGGHTINQDMHQRLLQISKISTLNSIGIMEFREYIIQFDDFILCVDIEGADVDLVKALFEGGIRPSVVQLEILNCPKDDISSLLSIASDYNGIIVSEGSDLVLIKKELMAEFLSCALINGNKVSARIFS